MVPARRPGRVGRRWDPSDSKGDAGTARTDVTPAAYAPLHRRAIPGAQPPLDHVDTDYAARLDRFDRSDLHYRAALGIRQSADTGSCPVSAGMGQSGLTGRVADGVADPGLSATASPDAPRTMPAPARRWRNSA